MSDDKNNSSLFDDYLSMSDEDFEKIPMSELYNDDTQEEDTLEVDNVEEDIEDESESEGSFDEEDDTEVEEEYEEEEYTTEEEADDEYEEDQTESNKEEEEESDDEENVDESNDDDTNYKTLYEDLMAPFKANKKEIKVSSPEELRRLAQMGVGYNAKMAEIKPLRKIGKMLENAGLLDEAKINYLIDLSKNDHGAINKLIKDSGIDPLDLDTESTDYNPNEYNVNDAQLDLEDTLTELNKSDSGRRVVNDVANQWDEESKDVLINNPNMLVQLEAHVDDGTYDKIINILEEERAKGNIPENVTDLQAYIHIGNHLAASQETKETAKPKSKPKVVKKDKNAANRNKLRKAATTTRGKATKKTFSGTDYLSMSDEEFEKNFS